MRMMFQMINTKTHRTRREVWEIGDDGHHFVPAWAAENQVVRRVMNDDIVGMIGERADAKRDEQTEPPIAESKRAHCAGDRCLKDNNRNSNQRSPWIPHHQLANFRMHFDKSARPPRMRLIRFRLIKCLLHCPSNYALQ